MSQAFTIMMNYFLDCHIEKRACRLKEDNDVYDGGT